MIDRDDDVLSGWDYAIPVVGAAAALLWVRVMSVRLRAQEVREQRFGDSLRDQINRQLAHYAYHVGQIVFVGKMVCNDRWNSLTIPRGKSNEYNIEKFGVKNRK